tara:strand:- start:1339 stop:1572 length:234 start_codon:yes stop_codon:yes gene_type:complete
MTNVFDTAMKFEATQFPNFYKSTNATKDCFVEYVPVVGWVGSYQDAVTLEGDEDSFLCPTDAIKWLEAQVPFTITLN